MPTKPTCANCDQCGSSKRSSRAWCHPRRAWRWPHDVCKFHPARRKEPLPEEVVDAKDEGER